MTAAGPRGRPALHLRVHPGRLDDTVANLDRDYKGRAQHIAPILDFGEDDDITITLTNLGLIQRPDLTDSHTLHWHGFVNADRRCSTACPEVSVAVPIGRRSSPTSTGRTTRARTCTTATSRTSSTSRWA